MTDDPTPTAGRPGPADRPTFDTVDTAGARVALRYPDDGELDDVRTVAQDVMGGVGGTIGVRLCAPLWLVTEPGCTGDDGCRCGNVDLAEAISRLTPAQRTAAVRAHTAALGLLHAHLLAADTLSDGTDSLTALAEACPACLLETEEHATALRMELLERTLDLAVVLRLYHITITVGDPRFDPGR